jgi:hypothetical protein
MQKRIVSMLALALCLGTGPVPTPPAITQWLGVSLLEPQADVIASFGEAGLNFTAKDNSRSYHLYNVDGAKGTVDVVFSHGVVAMIGLNVPTFSTAVTTLADPFGITLDSTRVELTARRGAGEVTTDARGWTSIRYSQPDRSTWTYSFRNGDLVKSIALEPAQSALDALPAAPVPVLHTGTSFDDALVDGAKDEASGARDEEDYLLTLRCLNNGGMWREASQRLVNHNGKPYDVLHLTCYRSSEERDLYFEISSFFGKR